MSPKSSSDQLNIRLPESDRFRLEAVAYDQGLSLSGLVRQVLGDRSQAYAEQHGGMERIVGQYREAKLHEAEDELAALRAQL